LEEHRNAKAKRRDAKTSIGIDLRGNGVIRAERQRHGIERPENETERKRCK
jgi:hypothetical protein